MNDELYDKLPEYEGELHAYAFLQMTEGYYFLTEMFYSEEGTSVNVYNDQDDRVHIIMENYYVDETGMQYSSKASEVNPDTHKYWGDLHKSVIFGRFMKLEEIGLESLEKELYSYEVKLIIYDDSQKPSYKSTITFDTIPIQNLDEEVSE